MAYPKTKTAPWDHQKKFIKFVLENKLDAAYAAFDMGCGKTKTAIDYANAIDAKLVLIVCPKKVIGVWPRQFKIHSHKRYSCLALDKGTVAQKAELVKKHVKNCQRVGQPAVVIINYESYWRPPLGPVYVKNRFKRPGVLSSVAWDLMICDEAHRIKSPGGAAVWGAKRLAKCAQKRLWLSGTPMPSSPVDLYAQFRALDPTVFGTRLQVFKNNYCQMGGFEGRQIVAYKNLEDLNARFYSIAQYVSADEALDLPDKSDINIEFDLEPKTLKLYKALDDDLCAQIDENMISASNILVKLLRLAQLAGGYLQYDNGGAVVIDNNKIETVVELLKDLPDTEPVVIFCRFTNEINRLREAIDAEFNKGKKTLRPIGEISGSNPNLPTDFTDGIWHATDTNTLLVQIATGGEGIDLSAARYAFFASIGYSLGQYRQAKRRLWRPGQTKKVFYYHVVAKHTVDKKIAAAIGKKREIVDYIIEGISSSPIKSMTADAISTALGIFNGP